MVKNFVLRLLMRWFFFSEVYYNIANLRSKNSKIRVSCVDQISPLPGTQSYCAETQGLGAYAFGTSKEYHDNTIVFCPEFFSPNLLTLGEREKNLYSDASARKDPKQMMNKAATMIHELSHLPAIQELDKCMSLRRCPS